MATGAPDNIKDYRRLRIRTLTTNQEVGSSNLSGRASKIKRLVVNSANRFFFGLIAIRFVVASIVALELGFAVVGHFAYSVVCLVLSEATRVIPSDHSSARLSW